MAWFMKIVQKYRMFMYGRYGYDAFSKFLAILSLILMLLSNFIYFLYPPAIFLFFFLIFRTYSKNIPARIREREWFFRTKTKLSQFFKRTKNRWAERKTHRYYKCKGCKNHLRVPKGKGKIQITCPICKNKMIKRT